PAQRPRRPEPGAACPGQPASLPQAGRLAGGSLGCGDRTGPLSGVAGEQPKVFVMPLSAFLPWLRRPPSPPPAPRPRWRPHPLPRRLEQLEDRTAPAVSWTGAGDGTSWGDARDWSGGKLPGAADDVDLGSGSVAVVHTSGSDAVRQLTSHRPLLLSGGT